MQRYTETTHRSVAWIKKASDDGRLEMKPPFQRNPVWSIKQQGALIETMLLEYPIPEIYMQDLVTESGDEKHIVVDGQQRIRAVLDYIASTFDIDEEGSRWTGMSFEDLTPEDKKKIYEYKLVTRVLPEMADEQIRSIFQRINRNTVVLNAQELRHATYWGPFIKLMEEISDLDVWSDFGIFSANDRRRMTDTEFVSEITIAYLNGLQNKKVRLETYYQMYETEFDDAERVKTLFYNILGEIHQALPNLRTTRWKKKSDFYSLFLALAKYEEMYPLDREKRDNLGAVLVSTGEQIDGIIRLGISAETDKNLLEYIQNVERAASDLGSRRARANSLDRVLKPILHPKFLEPKQS